jgi:hypothetical protein
MWHVWWRREVFTGFWWGSLRERDHWGDPDVDGRINNKPKIKRIIEFNQ